MVNGRQWLRQPCLPCCCCCCCWLFGAVAVSVPVPVTVCRPGDKIRDTRSPQAVIHARVVLVAMPPCHQTASTQSVIKTIADTFQKPWIKWIAGEVFEGDKKFAKSLGDGKWNFKLQDENDDCEKHRPARLCPLPRLASAHTCTCRRLAICRCADFGIALWSL